MAIRIRMSLKVLCFFSCIKILLAQCDYGALTAKESIQFLQSPNYPENYPEDISCKWTIRTVEGSSTNDVKQGIHIHIENWVIEDSDKCDVEYLAIEDTGHYGTDDDANRNKSSDGAEIIPDKSTSATKFEKIVLCAAGTSSDYYSETSEVTLTLVTSSDITKKGWKPPHFLNETEVTRSSVVSSDIKKKGFQLEYSLPACPRNFTAPWGQIKQTLFKNDTHCFTTISASSSNHTISLYFSEFYMEAFGDDGCTKNYLEVRDGLTAESPLIGKFCGFKLPDPIFSSGQYLWLHVYTEVRTPFTNATIDITYTTTNRGKGCGGEIKAASGVFTSPNFPQNYNKNSVCRWGIFVPTNLVAEYTFTSFDMGPANTCETDYIEIFDYNDIVDQLTLRGRFCGGSQPTKIRTTTDYSIVKYTTSVQNEGTGWKLSFKSVSKNS